MGDLVSDGTSFSCPFCPAKLKISVSSSLAEGDSKKLGNTSNSFFPPPGGQCTITSSPCIPNVSNIDPGQKPVQIDGKMALGVDCKFQCSQGGTLTVASSSQTTAKHENTFIEATIAAGVVAAAIIVPEVVIPLLVEAEEGTALGGSVLETAESAEVAETITANSDQKIATSVSKVPGRGTQKETFAPRPIKSEEATSKWDEFLGEGPHTNTHPRTGKPDPDRIVSKDGTRSIRYGDHEMNSSPNRHHYHEETWKINPENNTMDVDNAVVRIKSSGSK